MPWDLDLVLVGATGFVGRLTAAHLAHHAPAGLRIALAGRSAERLAAVAAILPGPAADWPLLTVDVSDDAAVAELAGRTRAVATTVGPYAVHGLPLVRACAAAGTHYADLTGEVLFVHASVAACHEQAQRTGARIVHACGFDSVPSDLAVLLTAQAARTDGAGDLADTVLRVRGLRGGVSGGTIDSMRQQVLAARRDPVSRRVLADPQSLSGDRRPWRPTGGVDRASPAGGPRPGHRGPIGRDSGGRWQAPFVMAPFNTRIVRRSDALLGYGPAFSYREVMDTGPGLAGAGRALGLTVGLGVLGGSMAWTPTRAVADRLLLKPGEGPDADRREAGRFRVEATAVTTSAARYRTTVAAELDPGYDGTAVMLGESALALAVGEGRSAGVLTPAAALGERLADRLRARGFTVETERLDTDRGTGRPVGDCPVAERTEPGGPA